MHTLLVLHSLGITFGKHQRGAGRILLPPCPALVPAQAWKGSFCRVRHALSRYIPLAAVIHRTMELQSFLKNFCDCDRKKNRTSKGRMKGRILESADSLKGHLCMGEFPVHSLGTAMYNLHLLRAEVLWVCVDPAFS